MIIKANFEVVSILPKSASPTPQSIMIKNDFVNLRDLINVLENNNVKIECLKYNAYVN